MESIRKIKTQKEDTTIYEVYDLLLGDTVIGEASITYDDDFAYIDRIDVWEAYRNQGHGTAFLSLLSDEHSDIDTVLAPDNEDAQRLYDRIGVEVTQRREAYEHVDQGYGVYRI